LVGADAARRALAAGFVGKKAHGDFGQVPRLVLLGEYDDRRRTDEGTGVNFLQRIEIQRDVGHRGRQNAARSAAGEIAIQLVAGLHAAAIFVPGWLTRPLTENERRPLRSWLPCEENQALPFSSTARTQCMVSMLCSSVGRPNRPFWATNGGRRRGMPRLPSIDSIMADSSPHM